MVVRCECRRTESERERLLTVKRYRENERITANAFATDSKLWRIAYEISKVWGKRAERSGESSGRRVARRDENEMEEAQRCTKIRNP